jgi:hypothetical protein
MSALVYHQALWQPTIPLLVEGDEDLIFGFGFIQNKVSQLNATLRAGAQEMVDPQARTLVGQIASSFPA